MARTDTLPHFLTDIADTLRSKNKIYSGLPNEYQGIEYIEADGTQYINTGFYPAVQSNFIAEHCFSINTGYSGDNCVCGARYNGDVGNGFKMPNCYGGLYELQCIDRVQRQVKTETDKKNIMRFEVKSGDTKIILNDMIISSSPYVGTCDSRGTLYLLALHQTSDNTSKWYFHGKLYYSKIWENGSMVRNFIPCYRKADNVVGLYDTVNSTFYTNAGTGTFTAGPTIEIQASTYDTAITNIPSDKRPYAPSFVTFRENTQANLDYETLNLDTSNMTSMERMFYYCTGVTSLDVSNFDMSNANSLNYMFQNCSYVTSIKMPTATNIKVTSLLSMFYSCTALKSIDLSGLTPTVDITNMSNLFSGCYSLQQINLASFNLNAVTSYSNMLTSVLTTCEIIVKDADSKAWMTSHFPSYTNVKTLAEYEAE